MVVADINDDDAARHVRKQRLRQFGNSLRWDSEDNNLSALDGIGNGNRRRADLGRQRSQAV